ncbi:hypothetical protein PIB30_058429 [Stylosanthes scabra]|uniref:non-specific serine/threonine protein kinase n=1 Tax=Stylosanthes scabra TaxID=79078 RepID=A0ABU6XK55_9FABA|nr:hypothetical protein [Stylosanthes scabra]
MYTPRKQATILKWFWENCIHVELYPTKLWRKEPNQSNLLWLSGVFLFDGFKILAQPVFLQVWHGRPIQRVRPVLPPLVNTYNKRQGSSAGNIVCKCFKYCLSCLCYECMLLVYEYLERGSLFYNLANKIEAQVELEKEVKIIKGTAYALTHMHRHCTPPIVHRDVNSNNILLNSELEAYVSDFSTQQDFLILIHLIKLF